MNTEAVDVDIQVNANPFLNAVVDPKEVAELVTAFCPLEKVVESAETIDTESVGVWAPGLVDVGNENPLIFIHILNLLFVYFMKLFILEFYLVD